MKDMINDALDWIEDHPDAAKQDILATGRDAESAFNQMIHSSYVFRGKWWKLR